jgi:hypothetical protein
VVAPAHPTAQKTNATTPKSIKSFLIWNFLRLAVKHDSELAKG